MRAIRKRRCRCSLFHLWLFCFLIIANVAIQGQSSAESDEVLVFIDGPDMVQTNTTVEYTIKITGGPAEEGGNWSFEARLEGDYLGDAKVEPHNGTSYENIFRVNLTTPKTEQTMKLAVNGTSFINETNVSWSGDVFQEIKVFEPIIVNISATIRNIGQADVEGAVVSFYVSQDGAFTLLGNRTVDVPANSTEKVYMEWVASKDDEGEHEVEVRINENGALLELDNGDNTMRKTIYVGERPQKEMRPIMIFNNDGIVFIIALVGIFFLLIAFLMRRQTIRGRGYYGPGSEYTLYFEGVFMIALSLPVFYVSQILSANPEVDGDPFMKLIGGILIFVLGFSTILLTWDRTRKKRR